MISKFQLISGNKDKIKKNKIDRNLFYIQKYYNLYLDCQYGLNGNVDKLKAVYYGIKYIARVKIDNLEYKKLLQIFSEIQDIICIFSNCTYNEIINMFPIIKEYDGNKFECKDYFSTLNYLKSKKLDDVIGYNNVEEFCFEYYNYDIMNFSIKQFLIIDRINRYENKPGLLETFLNEVDVNNEIHIYTYNQENNYMYDKKTGKTFKLEKPKKKIPKYLRVIKDD